MNTLTNRGFATAATRGILLLLLLISMIACAGTPRRVARREDRRDNRWDRREDRWDRRDYYFNQ